MTELPRNLHIPEPVMLLLQAEDRMGDHWSEASTYARQSMWQNLHYRADPSNIVREVERKNRGL